jgi:hypothetical protein
MKELQSKLMDLHAYVSDASTLLSVVETSIPGQQAWYCLLGAIDTCRPNIYRLNKEEMKTPRDVISLQARYIPNFEKVRSRLCV